MGILDGLFGGGGKAVGEAVSGALDGVGRAATQIRSAITGDVSPEAKAKLEEQANEIDRAVMLAQAEINKAEAASPRFFSAGWRPGLAWLFVAVIGLHYLIWPILGWILAMCGRGDIILPAMDIQAIWPVLIGLLGLGTLRTVEKAGGSQGNH